jgi:hypothetical protein
MTTRISTGSFFSTVVHDDGVEVVVGLPVDLDQPRAHGGRPLGGVARPDQPRLGIEGDLDGSAAALGGHGGVLLGVGGAHPDRVGQVRHQPGQGRDQPAGAPAGGAAALLVAPERHRAPVRQQHHRQVRAGTRHRIPRPPLLRLGLTVHFGQGAYGVEAAAQT